MTENSEEIAEIKRAHTALQTRVETLVPILATKVDLEVIAARIVGELRNEMDRRFTAFETRLDKMQTRMESGFERIWRWIAATLFTALLALVGVILRTQQSVSPTPAVTVPSQVYYVYPPAGAPPANSVRGRTQDVAPPSQP